MGRPPITSPKPLPVSFRLHAEVKAAAERAAADDHRSLSSLVEKLLVDHLRQNGYLPTGSGGMREAGASTSPAEKAVKVRSKAASAADDVMSGMDVSDDVKAGRRHALTEKPPMVAKARAKRKG